MFYIIDLLLVLDPLVYFNLFHCLRNYFAEGFSALHLCLFVTDCYRCSFSLTSLTSLEVFPLAFQKKGRQRGAAPTFPVGNISEAQPEGTQHRHASAHKGLQDKNWGGSLPVEHL